MKVLVIDDEPNVREGLKKIISWEDKGFKVCGEGIDGQDGLEKILLLDPDLVLVDIKMPGLTGIEVIEKSKKAGFRGKFIITTGYSDFTYAKKAMSLGVEAYILKPIDEDELDEMVERIKEKLSKEKEIIQRLDVSDTYVFKSLVSHLLLGSSLSSVEANQYKALKQSHQTYQLVLVDIEDKKDEVSLIEEQIRCYLGANLELKTLMIERDLLIIISNTQGVDITQAISMLQDKMEKRHHIRCKMALETTAVEVQDLAAVYEVVKDFLEKKFLYPKQNLLTKASIEKYQKESVTENPIHMECISDQIYPLLQVGDEKRIDQVLQSLKVQLQNKGVNKDKVISIFSNILVKSKARIVEIDEEMGSLLHSGEKIIEAIYHCRDVEDVIKYVEEQLHIIVEAFKVNSPDSNMKKIIYYIDNNYNKELKLESLAELFNYNSAYLGKSFKNYTGQSFNSYIDKLRISKAKELLLHDNLKVYEIAKAVGYKHIDYFHSKFKKYVGISPLEYKKNKESDSQNKPNMNRQVVIK